MTTIQLNTQGDLAYSGDVTAIASNCSKHSYATTTIDNSIKTCLDGYGIVCNAATKNDIQDAIDKVMNPPKPDVNPETKSTINCNGKSISITFYENGYKKNTKTIMPDIVDVLVYNDSVVTVKFADGTSEKAVKHPDDTFSIEQGVSICIAKKLAGGSSVFNKLVERVLKVKNDKEAAELKKREEAARQKEKNRINNLKRAERNRKKQEKEANNIATAFKSVIVDLIKEIKNMD